MRNLARTMYKKRVYRLSFKLRWKFALDKLAFVVGRGNKYTCITDLKTGYKTIDWRCRMKDKAVNRPYARAMKRAEELYNNITWI